MMNDIYKQRTPSTAANGDIAGFATPVEAAKFLHLSRAMVHKLIVERKIPACRYGRAVRIPWAWLTGQTRKAGRPNA